MNEPITVFFAADTGYYQHLCVALTSILENNRSCRFAFYVLTDRAGAAEEKNILALRERYENFDIRFIAVSNDDVSGFRLNMSHITIQTYYRYFIPVIAPDLDKALYLDCDLIVDGDIAELWNTNIEGYCLAGVEEAVTPALQRAKKAIGHSDDDTYVNAGVLLMNLDQMRKDEVTNRLIDDTRRHVADFPFQDQDVINFSLKGRIRTLAPKYNWTHHCCDMKRKGRMQETDDVVIAHYTSYSKPWNAGRLCKHDKAMRYFHYLEKTPYRDNAKMLKNEMTYFYRYCLIPSARRLLRSLVPRVLVDFVKSNHTSGSKERHLPAE